MEVNVRRTTVYLNSDLYKALRMKAAGTEHSVSKLVNEAIRFSLKEDAVDMAAFEKRGGEPLLAFEDVLKKLKKDGKL